MRVVALSSREFAEAEIPFSHPAVRDRLSALFSGYSANQFEVRVLLARDEQPPAICRGGLIVPLSPGCLLIADWPVAETRAVEDLLLKSYAGLAAGLSPPRVATLLSEIDVPASPPDARDPFVPLTEILRFQHDSPADAVSGSSEQDFRLESHSAEEAAVCEFLKATEHDSHDLPEFHRFTDWRIRLVEFQNTAPQATLFITSLSAAQQRLAMAVWSFDPQAAAGEVHYLGVHAAARGRGWGKKLLREICAEAAQRGARTIGLNVDSRNQVATRLYDSAGFKDILRQRLWISRDMGAFSTGSTHDASASPDF